MSRHTGSVIMLHFPPITQYNKIVPETLYTARMIFGLNVTSAQTEETTHTSYLKSTLYQLDTKISP